MRIYGTKERTMLVQWDGKDETKDQIRRLLGYSHLLTSLDGGLFVTNKQHGRKDKVAVGEYLLISSFPVLEQVFTEEQVEDLVSINKIELL
jgi:hypothetical protein